MSEVLPSVGPAVEISGRQQYSEEFNRAKLSIRRTGQKVFQVPVINGPLATLAAALVAEGLPATGTDFDAALSTGALCTKRTPAYLNESQSREYVIVTCEFSNEGAEFGGAGGLVKSLSYSTASQEESYYVDRTPAEDDGPKYAVNTAGVPFTELPKRQRSHRVLTVTIEVDYTKTMADFDDFDDCINSDPITLDGVTYAAKTLLLSDLSLSAAVMSGESTGYKTLGFKLTHNRDTWTQKFESRGTLYKDGSGKLLPTPTSDVGTVSEFGYPLDWTGNKASLPTSPPAIIELQPYAAVVMASLFPAS